MLGLAKRGFFIPCRYAGLADETPPGYPALEPAFRAAEPAFAEMLERIAHYGAALTAIGAEPPPQPRWRQSWFPRLDAAAAYAFVRERKPKRIVEVGCGHSTRFFARAIADGGLRTELTAIDPAPRASDREPAGAADPRTGAAGGAASLRRALARATCSPSTPATC